MDFVDVVRKSLRLWQEKSADLNEWSRLQYFAETTARQVQADNERALKAKQQLEPAVNDPALATLAAIANGEAVDMLVSKAALAARIFEETRINLAIIKAVASIISMAVAELLPPVVFVMGMPIPTNAPVKIDAALADIAHAREAVGNANLNEDIETLFELVGAKYRSATRVQAS